MSWAAPIKIFRTEAPAALSKVRRRAALYRL